ncbi:hypothetical protein [Rosistilla carotiformis]|uniref:hypothetical protein n=1 Tax=Rosistilla carotiformis TaxID=2528017 RepID=UPI0011A468FF|nr:hypothetical protein [Rosistilla carotiformis]
MPSKSPGSSRLPTLLLESRWPIWLAAWNGVAVILFIRGLARESASVSSWQIAVVGMLLIAATNVARWLAQRSGCDGRQASATPPRWLPFAFTPAAVILTLWLTALHPSWIATVFIWLLLLASEVACLFINWPFQSTLPNLIATLQQRVGISRPTAEADLGTEDLDAPPLADDVDQRIQRSTREGVDEVHGLLRVRYQPGQRVATLFAGFVPPLRPKPTAEAEVIWGSEASVSIVDIHAQGIELELRRDSVDDGETSTIVEFFASTAEQ